MHLLTGSADCTLKLWSIPAEVGATAIPASPQMVDTGLREVRTLSGHAARLSTVGWHPSGRWVGSSSYDTTWRLWDVESGVELLLQEGHAAPVYALAFHPDGSLVASGDLSGAGRLWDLRSGRAIWSLAGHTKQLVSLDFSPCGLLLASGADDNSSIVWDLRKSTTVATLPAHTGMVSRVKFTPTRGLVTASFDASVKTWRVGVGGGGRAPGDWTLASSHVGHEGKVSGLDVPTYRPLAATGGVPQLDGARFFTAGADRTWKVWGARG